MSTATKLAQRMQHSDFAGQQQQRLAQDTARKVNSFNDTLAALTNRAYATLTTDVTNAVATYATLLTANITTVLASGFLIITISASGGKITNAGTPAFQVVVDGVATKACRTSVPLNFSFNVAMTVRVAVTRGAHIVLLQWKTDSASAVISAATVVENHAHLLVQEAS